MTNINWMIIGIVVVLVVFIMAYKLKPSKSRKQKLSVELVEIAQQTHDTIIFTFMLPDSSKKLGLKIGQHIEIQQNIKGQIVKRKYTPISPIDKVGSFQLLLKIYRPIDQFPNGGKMSCFLADLKLHSKITITLPFGRFHYLGKSKTQIVNLQGKITKKKYKNFYMIAGGTGITPIFQIIQYCCDKQHEDERPGLYLLFANRTQDDILMKSVLDGYAQRNYNVHISYSVDRSITTDWQGFTGYVSEDKVQKTIPQNVKQTLFMSCGPPPLCNSVQKIWKGLNVQNDQIYRF